MENSASCSTLKPIETSAELEFAVFCIENTAIRLGVSAGEVYDAFTEKSNILNGYIVPCFDVLHTLSKEYIVDDLVSFMQEKGVSI